MSRTLFLFALVLLASATEARSQNRTDAYGDPLPAGALTRIGTLRYRLNEYCNQPGRAAFSPDGKWIAATGPGQKGARELIQLWELSAWTLRATFDNKNEGDFLNIAFTPDSKRFAVYDRARQGILLFEVATKKLLQTLPLAKKLTWDEARITITPDNKTLICSLRPMDRMKEPRCVQVWDLPTSKLKRTIEIPDEEIHYPSRLEVSADGSRLVRSTANANKGHRVFEIYDLENGKLKRKIECGFGPMFDTYNGKYDAPPFALSADGKWLACSNGAALCIYDILTGKELHYMRTRRMSVDHMAFSPDSAHLYVAESAGYISQWSVARGERIAMQKAPFLRPASHFAFPRNGTPLAMAELGTMPNAYFCWEATTGKALSPVGVPASVISGLSFSAQGELFVASAELHASWWNPLTGMKAREFRPAVSELDAELRASLMVGEPAFARITLSKDGRFLAATAADDVAAITFDAKTGKGLFWEEKGSFFFLDGGTKTVGLQGGKVRIWASKTGRDLLSFEIPQRMKERATLEAVAPNGRFFAFSAYTSDAQARAFLWDNEQRKTLREWDHGIPSGVAAFSPDNCWLLMADEHIEVLTRVGTFATDYALQLSDKELTVTQAAFSPDGRELACGVAASVSNYRRGGKILIYEIASKKLRRELVGHPTGVIGQLAFSHDSALLASGASDTTALVWPAGLRYYAEKPAYKNATAEELADRFQRLASLDPAPAWGPMIELARTPRQTVELFRAKIAVAAKADVGAKSIPQWIADLASSQFAVRSNASAMLQKLGAAAEPDLVTALQKPRDAEMRRRLEALLDAARKYEWSADELRHARAVEVLDAITTPDARALLTRWAGGEPSAVLTQEAARAVKGTK